MAKYDLILGDCIEEMQKLIKDGVKVDLTITSPPYDTTRDYDGTLTWNFEVPFLLIYISWISVAPISEI